MASGDVRQQLINTQQLGYSEAMFLRRFRRRGEGPVERRVSRPDGTGGVPSGDTRPIVELELAGARPRWGTIATIAYSDGYRGGTGQVRAQETRSMRVTPEEQRAGQRSRSAPDGNLYLCVDVTVTQGAVGVLVTSLDGVEIGEAHRDQVDQYVAAVPLPSAGSAGESGSGTSTPTRVTSSSL